MWYIVFYCFTCYNQINYPDARLYTLSVDLSELKILDEQKITEYDRNKLKQKGEANRSKGIALANEICRKYRREGRFFDEILKEGE